MWHAPSLVLPLLVLIGLLSTTHAAYCTVGVDKVERIECNFCSELPIDVMLILDDSSSVNNYIQDETAFADAFISAIMDKFQAPRFGLVFFSLCMDTTMNNNDQAVVDARCANGNKTFRHNIRPLSEFDLQTAINNWDHGCGADYVPNTGMSCKGHFGTPLSVGYNWAHEILVEDAPAEDEPERIRVAIMISDGEPTYPLKDGGGTFNYLVGESDKWSDAIKGEDVISMTVFVGAADQVDEDNMKNWASSPKSIWARPRVAQFSDLLGKVTEMVDILCFYTEKITPYRVETTGQSVEIEGRYLFSMEEGNGATAVSCRYTIKGQRGPYMLTEGASDQPASASNALLENAKVTCPLPENLYQCGQYEVDVSRTLPSSTTAGIYTTNKNSFWCKGACCGDIPDTSAIEIETPFIFRDGVSKTMSHDDLVKVADAVKAAVGGDVEVFTGLKAGTDSTVLIKVAGITDGNKDATRTALTTMMGDTSLTTALQNDGMPLLDSVTYPATLPVEEVKTNTPTFAPFAPTEKVELWADEVSSATHFGAQIGLFTVLAALVLIN